MSNKVLQVYDFKVVDGTTTRSRICNFLNIEWNEFLQNYARYESCDNEWTMLCEVLYSQLDLISIYVSFCESVGLIRLTRSEEFYDLVKVYRRKIVALQMEKAVREEEEII